MLHWVSARFSLSLVTAFKRGSRTRGRTGLVLCLLWLSAVAAPPAVTQLREARPPVERMRESFGRLHELPSAQREAILGRVQRAFEGEPDKHEVAIRNFQKAVGLRENGTFGAETRIRLRQLAEGNGLADSSQKISVLADQPTRRTVFLDVKKNRWTRHFEVKVSNDIDFWLENAGLDELARPETRKVSSSTDLESLIGDDTTGVVQRGDALPAEWAAVLRRRNYLRNSKRSPKRELGEFIQATELLDRKAVHGQVTILSALPQSSGFGLIRELEKMNLDPREASGWEGVRRQIEQVQADSGFRIEAGTPARFLHELIHAKTDYIVLIAHFADGKLYFPEGEMVSLKDISALQLEKAPPRNLILISCEAGGVNRRKYSLAEMMLSQKLATNVIAHPEPVSALKVSEVLRDFLINGKTVGDAFISRGYDGHAKGGPNEGITRGVPPA